MYVQHIPLIPEILLWLLGDLRTTCLQRGSDTYGVSRFLTTLEHLQVEMERVKKKKSNSLKTKTKFFERCKHFSLYHRPHTHSHTHTHNTS